MAAGSEFLDIPYEPEPHRLAYSECGGGEETVLCVHGLTRNARDFDFLAEALADDFRIISVDMPGRGDSGWLKDGSLYNYQTYIFDIHYLLRRLNLSRVHWVGTSMGGIIGMMMAGTGMIRSLVLNDVGCTIAREGLMRILSYAGQRMEFATRAEAEAETRKICAPFGITEEKHWQHLFKYGLRENRFAYDPAIINGLPKQEVVEDIDLWPLWDAVKKIPTLLIRGERSDILRWETAREMEKTHPNLTFYEAANAGHAPALMADAQIAVLKEWLLRN